MTLLRISRAKRIERISAMPFTASYNGKGGGNR